MPPTLVTMRREGVASVPPQCSDIQPYCKSGWLVFHGGAPVLLSLSCPVGVFGSDAEYMSSVVVGFVVGLIRVTDGMLPVLPVDVVIDLLVNGGVLLGPEVVLGLAGVFFVVVESLPV